MILISSRRINCLTIINQSLILMVQFFIQVFTINSICRKILILVYRALIFFVANVIDFIRSQFKSLKIIDCIVLYYIYSGTSRIMIEYLVLK